MKIIIINGDATSNRGDRSILLGNIILLKKVFPDAEIRALSFCPERDENWYDIQFYHRAKLFGKFKAVVWSDIIMWGGGELIQDDTSKIKIPFWFINIMVLSIIFRKKIIALGQGLGPVNSKFNKLLSKIMLNRLSLFFSRDNYSEKMIRDIGSNTKVLSSFDPAILVSDKVDKNKKFLINYLVGKEFEINNDDKIIGVGVRRWFHQRGSWIPHKYAFKYNLRKIRGEEEYILMKDNLAFLLDELVSKHNFKIIFFPMYTPKHEADDKVSDEILNLMKNKNDGFVIKDDFSPLEYLELVGGANFFFGIRLHSTILSTSLGIPSLTFCYAPKGMSYFEQLGIEENSFRIEDLLHREKIEEDILQFYEVIRNSDEYNKKILKSIKEMKLKLVEDGEELGKHI